MREGVHVIDRSMAACARVLVITWTPHAYACLPQRDSCLLSPDGVPRACPSGRESSVCLSVCLCEHAGVLVIFTGTSPRARGQCRLHTCGHIDVDFDKYNVIVTVNAVRTRAA